MGMQDVMKWSAFEGFKIIFIVANFQSVVKWVMRETELKMGQWETVFRKMFDYF